MADTTKIKNYDDLPPACRTYLEFLERELSVPIQFIGIGKDRDSLIVRQVD
jgi:adenylosuccinate synthase